MRTSHHSVSSAERLSSWLMALLGLVAYVGLVYALTLVPIQFEVPLPSWGIAVVLPATYGLLLWAWVRRPSIARWLLGTALLSGLHVALGMAREPLTALLDPALAGRALPWVLPPPLPELIGLVFLLVPLRDVLRAPVRLARERGVGPVRPSPSHRIRPAAAPQVRLGAPVEGSGSLSEKLLIRTELVPEPPVATASPVVAPVSPPAPTAEEEPRRRRAAARAERRRDSAPPRPGRSDVVLRIALDRIMGQLPPGTFLAPEDEVAASLAEPGYLKISGELVVTQLAEGVARVAWTDIAAQFPRHLVGLSNAEISEHLGDGLRLPLDEVIGQLPHELFVADTPEISIAGLDRIPVPFHPVEESEPAAEPVVQRMAEVDAPPAHPEPPVEAPLVVAGPEPLPAVSPEPVRRPDLAPVEVPAPTTPSPDEPVVRVSFDRVASEIPADAFRVPLEQVSGLMREPGSLLVPLSVVLPQLGEGLIRVSWDGVAAQFPRGEMALSDAEVAERLPEGLRLPLDEIIRQVPADLFLAAGPAADVRGLESFPAPFQPLLSDPAPEPQPAVRADEAPESGQPTPESIPRLTSLAEPAEIAPPAAVEPVLAVVASPEPEIVGVPEPVVALESPEETADLVEADPPLPAEPIMVAADDPEPALTDPTPAPRPVAYEPPSAPAPRWPEPAPSETALPAWSEPARSAAHSVAPVAGPAESGEARRIVALLAPIASFDVTVQAVEGVTVFALAAPTVAQETAVAAAGLALPLLMDRRLPEPVDQLTLRGPETALVLTPLSGPHERGPILAASAPRGGALALLEILCRRAAGGRNGRPAPQPHDVVPAGAHGLAPAPVPSRAAGLTAGLTAFGEVSASVLRDAESEAVFYFFLPAGGDVPAVGAFAQDLQAVMRKAAGSGAVFRTAIVRSGDTFLVIQPEEIGHGRSIVIVAGGAVTRPGLAYRQVERAAATLMSA